MSPASPLTNDWQDIISSGFPRAERQSAAGAETGEGDQRPRRLGGVDRFVPPEIFNPEEGRRRRVYTPWVTFVAFLGQVLSRGSAAGNGAAGTSVGERRPPSRFPTRTRAPIAKRARVCESRRSGRRTRNSADGSRSTRKSVVRALGQGGRRDRTFDAGHAGKPAEMAVRRQSEARLRFPTAQWVGLFCLATGRLVRFALDTWRSRDPARPAVGRLDARSLARSCWPTAAFAAGVSSRCSAQRRGCSHALARDALGQGSEDGLEKPARERTAGPKASGTSCRKSWPCAWSVSNRDSFRTQEIVLATAALLDEATYPSEAIADLYRRRWAVELFPRHQDHPGHGCPALLLAELVEKEIWMRVFGYNLVRALMLEASWTYSVPLDRLSFKGTVDTLRQWTPLFAPRSSAFRRARNELSASSPLTRFPIDPIATSRVKKRRPKAYQLLTRPRHQRGTLRFLNSKNDDQSF